MSFDDFERERCENRERLAVLSGADCPVCRALGCVPVESLIYAFGLLRCARVHAYSTASVAEAEIEADCRAGLAAGRHL